MAVYSQSLLGTISTGGDLFLNMWCRWFGRLAVLLVGLCTLFGGWFGRQAVLLVHLFTLFGGSLADWLYSLFVCLPCLVVVWQTGCTPCSSFTLFGGSLEDWLYSLFVVHSVWW